MNRIALGATGLEVTPIAYGTWQFGGEWGSFDEGAAVAAIRQAHDLGVNLFDTAQAYGFGISERILGQALADRLASEREQIVIATKGGLRIDDEKGLVRDSSPGWLRRGVEQSLVNLGVDHLDLYQVHWPDRDTSLAETGATLQELVDEGKVRHVGVSNFGVEEMAELSRTRPVETLQPPYHLFRREIESDVLPYAHEHGIGVLVYGPLAHGLLGGAMSEETTFPDDDWRSGSAVFKGEAFQRNLEAVHRLAELAEERDATVGQLAIAWALANPAVHVAIVGARQADHLTESVAAANLQLDGNDMQRIEEITSDAAAVAGPSPETV
jgi:aryl-alcohol dehydrogenase-like predicted oxidoreductase